MLITLFSVFGTRYIIKTGPHTSNYDLSAGICSRNSCMEWFKFNFLMTLLGFWLNVHPNPHVNILRCFWNCDFCFLVAIIISFITSWFLSIFFKLFICVVPILFNVNQNLGRNIIVLFIDGVSNLFDIVLTPLNLSIIILRLSFGKYFVNWMDYILTNLAIFYCFFDGFILRLSPKTDIGSQVLFIFWIW